MGRSQAKSGSLPLVEGLLLSNNGLLPQKRGHVGEGELIVMWLLCRKRLVTGLCLVILPGLMLYAQRSKPKVRRAKLPAASLGGLDSPFFENAFEKLKGARTIGTGTVSAKSGSTGNQPGDSPPATGSFNWSEMISSETIEDEVKSLKLKIDMDVNQPSAFAGRGYQKARGHFSMLAALFGVINEYDKDVRWKKDADKARDLFARTASNCKVGSIQAFNDAKARKLELQDLLSGSGLVTEASAPVASWEKVIGRSPLMKRLESSQQAKLQPYTASKGEFNSNIDQVLHEAQVVAVLSEILLKTGMEDADDEDYAAYAQRMKKAAQDISDAAKLNNHEAARKAAGEISKACTECHDGYRG